MLQRVYEVAGICPSHISASPQAHAVGFEVDFERRAVPVVAEDFQVAARQRCASHDISEGSDFSAVDIGNRVARS